MLHKNLNALLKNMQPKLMPGNYVFCTVKDISIFNIADLQLFFKEEESFTIIIKKELADELKLPYTFVAKDDAENAIQTLKNLSKNVI